MQFILNEKILLQKSLGAFHFFGFLQEVLMCLL